MPDPPRVDFTIEPSTTEYDPSDDRWLSQVSNLYTDLENHVGTLRHEVTPVAGQRGGVEGIILALGSAGAIGAAVEVFKAWLSRDRSRSLKLSIASGGEKRQIVVTGKGIGSDDIRRFMEEALSKSRT